MTAKTEPRHLDEKQLVEFEKTAPAQARLLRLWRETSLRPPWIYHEGVVLCQAFEEDIDVCWSVATGAGKAIVHSRNSAELNAAWLYWEMKRLRNQAERMEGPQILRVGSREYDERMDELGDEMFECEDNLAAISKALEEIR